jgi:hypothetical protein
VQAERAYDVWLEELRGGEGEPPDEGLSRVFGISREKAQEFLARIPRIVKHDASPQQARQLGDALRAIGGRVRFEPAGTTPRRSRRPSAAAPPQPLPAAAARTPSMQHAAAAPSPAFTPASASRHPQPIASAPLVAAARAPQPPPSAETMKQGTSDMLGPGSIAPPRLPSSQPPAVASPLHASPAAPAAMPTPAGAPAYPPSAHAAASVAPAAQAPGSAPPAAFTIPTPAPPAVAMPPAAPQPLPAEPEYVPIPAPVAPAPVLPAVAAAAVLDMSLPSGDRTVEPRHPLELRHAADVGSEGQQDWSHVGVGNEQAFALDRHVLSHAGALNLPASDRPPAPRGVRPPSERRPDPKRREPSQELQRARTSTTTMNPIEVASDIFRQAERSSWKVALHGHPVAGFILVLGTATTLVLLLYALVRI